MASPGEERLSAVDEGEDEEYEDYEVSEEVSREFVEGEDEGARTTEFLRTRVEVEIELFGKTCEEVVTLLRC